MRIVVTGATGNVGTSVLRSLAAEERVAEIVGIARRLPGRSYPKTSFVAADIVSADLPPLLRGADAVIHLAWLIQPGRDESVTYAVNVTGSRRVFAAAVEAGVPAVVCASSVGAYSPGPKDTAVDEAWPTEGISSSFYARQKAAVERLLDALERQRPDLRVVRLRPGLIFKREAATEIRRLFLGPFVPRHLIRPRLIPFVPDVPRLRFQAVHADDVGEAYRLAAVGDAAGPFNIAADPVIGPPELASVLGARTVRVPAAVLRGAAATAYALRLSPTEPGWVDMALSVPVMDTGRARTDIEWSPSRTSLDALQELIAGLGDGAGEDTPPLSRATSGPARLREILTGVGRRG